MSLGAGRRYGLVGPNGGGKSTLLRTILENVSPRSGSVERASGLVVAMLEQTPRIGCPDQTVVDRFTSRSGVAGEEANAMLGMVLFRDCSSTRVADLSIGELRRVDVTTAFATSANLLLLDEPSNHLDVPTLDMVDKALAEYRGAVVVVSHDRTLLESSRLDELWMTESGQLASWALRDWSLAELLRRMRW